jgi:hypothetical protein
MSEWMPPELAHEANRHVEATTYLLELPRSQEGESASGQVSREDLERLWHEQFVFLNKVKGAGLARREMYPEPREHSVPTGFRKPGLPRRFSLARPVRLVFGIGLFVGAIYVLGIVFGVHRDSQGRFLVDHTGNIGQAVENTLNALSSVWARGVDFFEPVLSTYGPSWTIVLLAALLLSVAYWVLARG